MSRIASLMGIVLFSMLISFSTTRAQNFVIDSISSPDTLKNCSPITATLNTYLGCTNWTLDSVQVNVGSSIIDINVFRQDPMICFGAITYPTHTANLGFLAPGTYTLKARAYGANNGLYNQVTKTLVVVDCCPNSTYNADFSVNDSVLCVGDSLFCTNTSTGSGYTSKWYVDGVQKSTATNFSTSFSSDGIYSVRLRNDSTGGCKKYYTREIVVVDIPNLNLGPDVSMCPGKTAVLDAGLAFDSLMWNTQDTTQSIVVSDSGWYAVTASDSNRCSVQVDSVLVSLKAGPMIDLGNDTMLCNGTQLILDATSNFCLYQWQDGSNNATFTVDSAGQYWVKLTHVTTGCQQSDSINVVYIICDGINELENSMNLQLGPNPFQQELVIYNRDESFLELQLLDAQSRKVLAYQGDEARIEWETTELEKGIYVLMIRSEGRTKAVRLLKK